MSVSVPEWKFQFSFTQQKLSKFSDKQVETQIDRRAARLLALWVLAYGARAHVRLRERHRLKRRRRRRRRLSPFWSLAMIA